VSADYSWDEYLLDVGKVIIKAGSDRYKRHRLNVRIATDPELRELLPPALLVEPAPDLDDQAIRKIGLEVVKITADAAKLRAIRDRCARDIEYGALIPYPLLVSQDKGYEIACDALDDAIMDALESLRDDG
jgi:hypothetical protein